MSLYGVHEPGDSSAGSAIIAAKVRRPEWKCLYLVRHGETEWNRQRRMQGRLDSRLTAEGRAHARVQRRSCWRAKTVGHLIVSPLGRTRETAELILDGLRGAGDVRRAAGRAALRRRGRDSRSTRSPTGFPRSGPRAVARSVPSPAARAAKTCRTCWSGLRRSPSGCASCRCEGSPSFRTASAAACC